MHAPTHPHIHDQQGHKDRQEYQEKGDALVKWDHKVCTSYQWWKANLMHSMHWWLPFWCYSLLSPTWNTPVSESGTGVWLPLAFVWSHKKLSEWKQEHVGIDGTLKKPTKLDRNDTTIFCAILPTIYPCVVLAICVHRRVVEGSGVGRAGWVCSACWCAWRSHVVIGCNLIATAWAWQTWSFLHAESVEYMSGGELVYHVGSESCCELSLLLTWHTWVVLYAEICGVGSAECLVGV